MMIDIQASIIADTHALIARAVAAPKGLTPTKRAPT